MNNGDIFTIVIPGVIILILGFTFFLWQNKGSAKYRKRFARVTNRKTSGVVMAKEGDMLSLRRKSQSSKLPLIGKIIDSLPTQAALRERLEKAGLHMATDTYLTGCLGMTAFVMLVVILLHRPIILSILLGTIIGILIPHWIVGYMGNKRVKKFLILFPDAIEFIVRGLRSGLPVTESMNVVAGEMEEPVRSIFSGISESVKLGVSVEKSLQNAAKKLQTTEFNFFVTSIILQSETGGNLAEILSNLSEVLRKRFMMRLKIKALSSEAKASAMIVGALPFVVILALTFLSPGYLNPLIDDIHGNIAAGGAVTSLLVGIGIMMKMAKFEI